MVPPSMTSAVDGSGQLHVPTSLPLGKEPPVPIRHYGEEKNQFLQPRIEHRLSNPQPVVIPTELSRFFV
jgi:hypothetical protein